MEISSVSPVASSLASVGQTPNRSPEARAETRELAQAARQVNDAQVVGNNSELVLSLDRRTGKPLVRIVDKQTREVIQQIPPEYVLRMAQELKSRY